MKKMIFIFLLSFILISCGMDKNDNDKKLVNNNKNIQSNNSGNLDSHIGNSQSGYIQLTPDEEKMINNLLDF